MNPVNAAIISTVSSGAGYGLLALLGLVANAHGRASSMAFGLTGVVIALVFITSGHLGRPQRDRQSSWLFRQVVAAVITYPIALGFGCVWSGLVDAPALIAPLGTLTTVMCAVTVFCTGMIYYSLKTIPAWHSKLTVPVYLAFGLASGSGLLNAISCIFGRFQTNAGKFMAFLTILLILIVTALKWFYWRNLQPAPGQNTMFMLLAVAMLLMLLSLILPWMTFIVALLVLAAAWVERQLFFAQAK